MHRFFFDVDDGERQTCDGLGICLPTLAEVEREVRMLLQNLIVPKAMEGRDRLFIAAVRDQDGATTYRATMSLSIVRMP